jgi:SAM-dependent methyltransferase
VRALLLDDAALVRAIGAGRRKGSPPPSPERVELRPVDLRSGRALQAVHRDGPAVRTFNHDDAARPGAVDALLAQPYGNWHVETTTEVLQLRVTKRGQALVHRASRTDTTQDAVQEAASAPAAAAASDRASDRAHDRAKQRLLDPDDPLFTVLGADGAKRRQVEAFVRQLAAAVPEGDPGRPLRVVDLGCGNAYLTFAASRWLSGRPGGAVTVGVELREDLVARSTARAAQAGLEHLSFLAGTIADADPEAVLGGPPDVVLALHACDTATDDALARAVRWGAPVVLAAPCCHRDVQRQLGSGAHVPEPHAAMVRSPILRERLADVLTDTLRAQLLRVLGYRVDVVEFVDSQHTPRNAMLRAVRPTPAPAAGARADIGQETAQLAEQWGVVPALATRLAPELAGASYPAAVSTTPVPAPV